MALTIRDAQTLAALDRRHVDALLQRIAREPCRGRPWSCSLRRRILITCVALRTNLTVRELAAIFQVSKSTAHRIVSTLTPRLAALSGEVVIDRRAAWVLDGTLVPTRDHVRAARSKNYRWSCNAQLLVRRCDLRVVASMAGGLG